MTLAYHVLRSDMTEREKYEALYAAEREAPGSYPPCSQLPAIVELLRSELPSGGRVVDLGCGNGTLPEMLGSTFHVTGIDFCEDHMTAIAADLERRVQSEKRVIPMAFRIADVTDLSCLKPTDEFDVAVSVDVLEHLSELEVPGAFQVLRAAAPVAVLSIAHFKDGPDNAPLHRTVEPWSWWITRINDFWTVVDTIYSTRQHTHVVVRR